MLKTDIRSFSNGLAYFGLACLMSWRMRARTSGLDLGGDHAPGNRVCRHVSSAARILLNAMG